MNNFDTITNATDVLNQSDNPVCNDIYWQVIFYHHLCLTLCDRFTPMELQPIVAEVIAHTNARIAERNQPCESSSPQQN